MFALKKDRWLEALFRLRRNHAKEIRSFHADEGILFADLFRSHQLAMGYATRPMQVASLISDQLRRLKQLERERNIRHQAVKQRQAEEIYNLMIVKNLSTIGQNQ